jgi:hypothetical protein
MNEAPPDSTTKCYAIDRRAFLTFSTCAAIGSCLTPAHAEQVLITDGPPPALSLKAVGDPTHGFTVVIHSRGLPLTSEGPGELDAVFQNGERSLEDRIYKWKANAWSGNERQITLLGNASLPNLNATVRLEVIYTVVANHAVRKTIRIHQSDMFMLYFQCTSTVQAHERPVKFWSFDQPDCRGGALREYFPAAGFRTAQNLTVGVLTDAGYRNGWSRLYRRDGKPIKPAPTAIPDPNLYTVANEAERQSGKWYVQQTFGEELRAVMYKDASPVKLPPIANWKRTGAIRLTALSDGASVLSSDTNAALLLPFHAAAGNTYSVEFDYRSDSEVAAALWDVDGAMHPIQNYNQFNDRTPASQQWTTFRSTVFVSDVRGSGAALVFSLPDATATAQKSLEVCNVRLALVRATAQPNRRLAMDEPVEITAFVFADDQVPDTYRGYRLASQLHLADALGFQGGETEKVLYADLMMLCWNVDVEQLRPMLAPSIYYSAAGEMYLRDSFFALNGCHNRELNEKVFNLWAENQGEDGAINTLVEPEMTNLERKSNDSTPLWLMWALLNRRRFHTPLSIDKLARAAQYCLSTYDPESNGICHAKFVMGQLDIVSYPLGTTTICQNQGLLAVTLRVIRELAIPGVSHSITDTRIENAEEQYRSYYDSEQHFMRPTRDTGDAIGFAELFPEYLSLLLFNRKIMTDEMVVHHLNRIPVMLPRADCPFPEEGGTVRPVFIGLTDKPGGWRFFTEKWHPLAYDSYAKDYASGAMDGIYYNGGSWMRIEICCYVAGMLHGWKPAEKAIKNRLWAEINIAPDFPTSQEYLATDPRHPNFGYHRVFAWNSSVLQALELAGMRTAAMDPDFQNRKKRATLSAEASTIPRRMTDRWQQARSFHATPGLPKTNTIC